MIGVGLVGGLSLPAECFFQHVLSVFPSCGLPLSPYSVCFDTDVIVVESGCTLYVVRCTMDGHVRDVLLGFGVGWKCLGVSTS